MYEEIRKSARAALLELLDVAALKPGQQVVIGCSSSEIMGQKIGKGSTPEAAKAVVDEILPILKARGLCLEAQCCEHLNRALIMERADAERFGYEIVCVRPRPKAGGSFATAVYEAMDRGLRAQVYRLGRLVGRATDGVFQRNPENNAFYMLLRAVQALGAMPSAMAGIPMDITPVDRAAEAAVALRDAPMTALHILSPHPPTMGEVVRAVLPQVQLVDEQAFEAMLEKGAQGAQAKVLSPLIETWTHAKMRPARIAPVCVKTARWLARLGAPLPEGRAGTLLAEFRDGGEGRDL